MNKAILVGNLTKDPQLRQTPNGISVVTFRVAVNRRYKSADGTTPTDFIDCVAWRQTAEFVARYFAKGSKIGIVGTIQSRSYEDQNGQRRYVTEVVCDDVEFVTSKAQNPAGGGRPPVPDAPPVPANDSNDPVFQDDISDDFEPLEDSELPF